ncbi:MAG: response regulator [Pseudomonadota bacterium]
MSEPPHILIVDDDASIRDAVSDYLSDHGFDTTTAQDAAEMDQQLQVGRFDLLVLDLMMPGEDGLSVCRRLGSNGPPILVLSALGETTDRIVGLEIGASDYLAKPFEPRELLARIRALLRRVASNSTGVARVYRFDDWALDYEKRVLTDPTGHEVSLTAGDVSLLTAFLERPGRILSRDQLLDWARGREAEAFDRSIDLAVSRIRGKLSPDGDRLIATVRGEGYRFTAKVHQ